MSEKNIKKIKILEVKGWNCFEKGDIYTIDLNKGLMYKEGNDNQFVTNGIIADNGALSGFGFEEYYIKVEEV